MIRYLVYLVPGIPSTVQYCISLLVLYILYILCHDVLYIYVLNTLKIPYVSTLKYYWDFARPLELF